MKLCLSKLQPLVCWVCVCVHTQIIVALGDLQRGHQVLSTLLVFHTLVVPVKWLHFLTVI